jgi:hypothetical protein
MNRLFSLNNSGENCQTNSAGNLIFPKDYYKTKNCNTQCMQRYSGCNMADGADQCEEVCAKPAPSIDWESINKAACWVQQNSVCNNGCTSYKNPYSNYITTKDEEQYCKRQCENGDPCGTGPSPVQNNCDCTTSCKTSSKECDECCGKCDRNMCVAGSGCMQNPVWNPQDSAGGPDPCIPGTAPTPSPPAQKSCTNDSDCGDQNWCRNKLCETLPSEWTQDFYDYFVTNLVQTQGLTTKQANCIANNCTLKFPNPMKDMDPNQKNFSDEYTALINSCMKNPDQNNVSPKIVSKTANKDGEHKNFIESPEGITIVVLGTILLFSLIILFVHNSQSKK